MSSEKLAKNKKWKLAINDDPGVHVCDYETRMKLIADVGFDGVFTAWGDGMKVGEVAETIAKAGLIYQSIHAPFFGARNMWENEGEEGEKATDELIRCVRACKDGNVPLMVLHPFIGFHRHTPTELGLTRYGRVIEEAEKQGIILGFENVEGMEYLAAIMERYGDIRSVGFVWDTGHELCYNFGEDMMAKYGDKLAGTHFNDNLGMADPNEVTWHDDLHQLPFDGIADWQGIMDRINRHGYKGILTFELTTFNKPNKHTHDEYAKWTAEEFYAKAYERAERVAALG